MGLTRFVLEQGHVPILRYPTVWIALEYDLFHTVSSLNSLQAKFRQNRIARVTEISEQIILSRTDTSKR
jgi:hypothetical protein